MFSWIRKAVARRERSTLVSAAAEQISRLTPGDGEAKQMLQGEALIISGVFAAIVALVSGAITKMDVLAKQHVAAVSDVAALRLQIAQLPTRQHLVAPAARGKRGQLASVEEPRRAGRHIAGFISRLAAPMVLPEDAVYGDAISTTAALTEHDCLSELIEAEGRDGISRHHHHVAKIWRWAALTVLFFDVVALATLTVKLENVAFAPRLWQEQFPEQAQRLLTAVCFALFGAIVLAVISHQVGAQTWRHIHRNSSILTTTKQAKRVLVGAWSLLAAMSALMGIAILVRLLHEAGQSNSGGSVGFFIALLIGFAGITAPLAVAMVEAMHSSPEVLRRAALARIVRAANHDEQSLVRQVTGRQTEMVELVATGERLLADTRRRVDAERLPAHQAILMLRSRHGYAGEYVAAIQYPEHADRFLPDFDHEKQFAPLVAALSRMSASTTAPSSNSDEDSTSGSADTADIGDAADDEPAVPAVLVRNGNPVPAG